MSSITSSLNVNVNAETKKEASKVLDELGLNMTTLINMTLKQVIKRKAVPFEISNPTYSTELENEGSFDSCCKNLDMYRLKLSKKVDRLVIISTTPLSKVAYELELFTENKVKVI